MSGQKQSQGASVGEQVQAVTMVDQEFQCTGNEELTTATEAEELQELGSLYGVISPRGHS